MQQTTPGHRDIARPVVVVGGANMDLKSRTGAAPILGTSNPGHQSWSPGGVGRNIAENLARLGDPVELVAAVGDDPVGRDLLARTAAAGVGIGHVVTSRRPTGVYAAVLDDVGELVIAVSDMAATDELTVADLAPARDLVRRARLVVVDGNLSEGLVGWLLDVAAAAAVPVVLDPVSVPKALHLRTTLSIERPSLAITPNLDELGAVAGVAPPTDEAGIMAAAAVLHDRGVRHVWVRRGGAGSLLSERLGTGAEPVLVRLAAPEVEVEDVTGGGDAMTAGFIHHYLEHGVGADAARFGQMAAALTVEVSETVRSDLTSELVHARMDAAPDQTTAVPTS